MICLTLADQIIKAVIAARFMQCELDLLAGIVRFRPILNTNLSWVGNYVSFLSNPWVMIAINIFAIFIFISGYLFYLQKTGRSGPCAKLITALGLSGCVCSLIDKIAWGGSLDFIQLPQLFTFDLKDCYISLAVMIFLPLGIIHGKKISVKEYLRFCAGRFKH